jgi:FkbM family methyltransferase
MHMKLLRYAYRNTAFLRRFIVIRRPVRISLPDFKMYVRLSDWDVGFRIAVKRGYEGHVTNVMRPLLQPGMVVVDVGANIGFYTLMAAARVGPSGRVIAFEPSVENCELLKMSLTANNFQHVAVHQVAVADEDGMVGFHMGSSNGSILRADRGPLPFQVPSVRLDNLLHNEPRIDLIKMDIEGAEGLALAGMKQLISRHRPIIFTEFSPEALMHHSEVTAEEYLKQLDDLGYDLHVIHYDRGQNPTPQTLEEIMADFASHHSDHLDLVAYPR